ncbi:MAG: DUF1294 domain-containing protein [Candidatus Choladocola sp.]|nr:DUF1294 domain-containing protein [Candidatus Choladocola sp.]
MKAILIIYVTLINLIGFLIMGLDKLKAKRRKWRIPEKTLFTVALLGGSIGTLTGMYVFRHKTRHLSFAIGIPAILVIQLLLISFLYTWNNKRMGSPAQAVQHELELIQELDSETIQSFVSYENLMNSHLSSGTISDETAEAVSLFFKNFKYSIHNEQIEGDEATVSVNITNIDMQALARDLCTAILKQSVTIYPDSEATTTSDYYELLRDTLLSNTYDLVVTTAYFHLRKDEAGWLILSDRTLEDELVSGFISCMNDPKLLSASAVLSIHLDALKELTADQWMDYLSVKDVFATYNTDYYQQIDEAYISALADSFDYEILKCKEEGNTATATVRIKSVDMTNVLTIYKQYLLEYAATTQSIRDNDVQFSNETSRLLLQSLKENTQTTATDVEITFQNNGTTWEIFFDEEFSNAVMGDMESAIETFNSITHENKAS